MKMATLSGKNAVSSGVSKSHNGYMTTTELARLCGVSRFTVLNWTKQGKIRATRTVGKHYRIPVSEALSFLRGIGNEKKSSSLGTKSPSGQQAPSAAADENCGNCLTSNDTDKQSKTKNNILYTFGYGVSRGVDILKVRRKAK